MRILLAVLFVASAASSSFGDYVVPCTSRFFERGAVAELRPPSSLHFEDTLPFIADSLDRPVVTRRDPFTIHVLQTGVIAFAPPGITCVSADVDVGPLDARGNYSIEWEYRIESQLQLFTQTRVSSFGLDDFPPRVAPLPPVTTVTPIVLKISGRTPNLSYAGDVTTQIDGSHIQVTLDVFMGPLTSFDTYDKMVEIPPPPAGRYDIDVTVRIVSGGQLVSLERSTLAVDVVPPVVRHRRAGR